MNLPNAIIGGTGRAGSTSLFRYLAAHPDVCGSSKKETQFFMNEEQPLSADALERYMGYFKHCDSRNRIRLEATPHYLHLADRVAPIICSCLPDVRLLFVLRNPAQRMFTIYRNLVLLEPEIFSALDFDKFVELAVLHAKDSEQVSKEPGRRGAFYLRTGCYADYIEIYLKYFNSENIYIIFFDDLKNDPLGTVKNVAEYLDIDPGFYNGYSFTIENKTRKHRSEYIYRLAHKSNMALETFFNKYPVIKRNLRSFYFLLNTNASTKMDSPSLDSISVLNKYYGQYNNSLRILLLKRFPRSVASIPPWLEPNTALD